MKTILILIALISSSAWAASPVIVRPVIVPRPVYVAPRVAPPRPAPARPVTKPISTGSVPYRQNVTPPVFPAWYWIIFTQNHRKTEAGEWETQKGPVKPWVIVVGGLAIVASVFGLGYWLTR